ncbi:PHP domain-containing protein [Deltaproteobacteria bacterium OttesenSCG-928-K17]|nr:PHP domain-containing protein [Deltaproteobacteria bacterium OttesenSCG-928-K17]
MNTLPPNEGRNGGGVDLHTHSSASDGALEPAELAQAAKTAGLSAVALTDHDTIDGLAAFKAAADALGLTAVGGVEISLEHSGTMHLLGLNAGGGDGIPAALKSLKTYRVERNLKMLDLLGRQGYYLSWEKLLETARGGQMGRPHFAALLLKKGYFKTRDEVFDHLLGKGKPGYVDKRRLAPEEGLAMLREARWAPVLAHPVSLGLEAGQWPKYIDQLKSWGLAGLEVNHPSHNPDQVEFFAALARNSGLVATGGSDYHGEFKPAAGLDWARLNCPFGLEIIDALAEKVV